MNQPDIFAEQIRNKMTSFTATPSPEFRSRLFPDEEPVARESARKSTFWWWIAVAGGLLLLIWQVSIKPEPLSGPKQQHNRTVPLMPLPENAPDSLQPVALGTENTGEVLDRGLLPALPQDTVDLSASLEGNVEEPFEQFFEGLATARDTVRQLVNSGFSASEIRQLFALSPYEAVLEKARLARKPVMLHVFRNSCSSCRKMDSITLRDQQVQSLLKRYEVIEIDLQDYSREPFIRSVTKHFDIRSVPAFIILSPEGGEYVKESGFRQPDDFHRLLQNGLRRDTIPEPPAQEKKLQIKVSPNPTPGPFRVELWGNPGQLELLIYNRFGEILRQDILKNFSGHTVRSYDFSGNADTFAILVRQGEEALTELLYIDK